VIDINGKTCTACGVCSDVCPGGVFAFQPVPGKGRTMKVVFPERCIVCGHCVAACPEGAVIHGEMPVRMFLDRPATSVSPEDIRTLLLSRRSVRAFNEKPVPGELITRLIEAGTHAGTASNGQTEDFVVIADRKVLSELEGMAIEVLWKKVRPLGSGMGRLLARMRYGAEIVRQTMAYYEGFRRRRTEGLLKGMVFRGAPAVVLVYGLRSNLYAGTNCAIAVRNMEIMAQSLGLGTCWAGLFLAAAGFDKRLARRLSIPDDRAIYGAIMLGYPKHEYKKLIPRKERVVRWV